MNKKHFQAVSLTVFLCLLLSCKTTGQTTMGFEEYDPVSTLVVPEHKLVKAKFPFIDVHNHQWDMPGQDLPALLGKMDSLNMKVMVNLSGRSYKESTGRNGFFDVNDFDYLQKSIDNINKNGSGRLVLFTNISFVGFGEKGSFPAISSNYKPPL
ncbi:MAG: hypothetical protein QM791_16830 [Ferruginibacter sp.]